MAVEERSQTNNTMKLKSKFFSRAPWLFLGFLVFIFFLGGGARADIQSLVILRPAAALMLGYALWCMDKEDWYNNKLILGLAGMIVLLAVSHVIPLPPATWASLPQGELNRTVDEMAGINGAWRPFALVPPAGLNALYSLIVPLAVLMLALRLRAQGWVTVLKALIMVGIISTLIGLVQIIGPNGGPLYLYRITNPEEAVGLFANRNHHAIFLACLFPLLAVFATLQAESYEQAQRRKWLAMSYGVVFLPMILIIGSRAGLIAAMMGIGSIPLLWKFDQKPPPSKRISRGRVTQFFSDHFTKIAAVVAGAMVIGATLYFSRAKSVSRFERAEESADFRFDIWGVTWSAAKDYFPWGAGNGSFVEVFQIYEPDAMLSPVYANHAHNDWLEVLLTVGVPGALIVLAIVYCWLIAVMRLWKNKKDNSLNSKLARLGAIIIAIYGFASAFDYPLRVPSSASLFVLAVVWLSRSKSKSIIAGTD